MALSSTPQHTPHTCQTMQCTLQVQVLVDKNFFLVKKTGRVTDGGWWVTIWTYGLHQKFLVEQQPSKCAKLGMSGHMGCIGLKINSGRNRNGHNVQIWLTTGHSSFFFFSTKNVLPHPPPHAERSTCRTCKLPSAHQLRMCVGGRRATSLVQHVGDTRRGGSLWFDSEGEGFSTDASDSRRRTRREVPSRAWCTP